MSWFEKLLDMPFRTRVIGVGQTEIEKIRLSRALYEQLIQDGGLTPRFCIEIATEERYHALADDGQTEVGVLLNLFGGAVGGYCRPLGERTAEQLYLNMLAGVTQGLVSNADFDNAAYQASLMEPEEVHALNQQICGNDEVFCRLLDNLILGE